MKTADELFAEARALEPKCVTPEDFIKVSILRKEAYKIVAHEITEAISEIKK